MFVAIPTAIPVEPLTSRFGKRDGRTDGSPARLVVVRLEVDGVRVDVAQHLGRDPREPRLGVAHRRRRDRRRSSRSCPARRRAGSAARTAAPSARACRRSPSRRAGGSSPSPRRPSRPTSCTAGSAAGRPRASRRGRAGARASGRRARRAARATTITRHRVVEEARAHLLLELARLDAARPELRLDLRHRLPQTSRNVRPSRSPR